MSVSFAEVETLFNTLPIGYYLGRDIDCSICKISDTSYFSPSEDKVVISYRSISNMAENADFNTVSLEEIIRGLLYHELSHVILTPSTLKSIHETAEINRVLNIVEDERIETAFKYVYMNVDFKRNIILLNNYRGLPPENIDEAFYQLVRYHKGSVYYLKKLSVLLERYMYISAVTNEYKVENYKIAIKNLYKEFKHDLSNNKFSSTRTKSTEQSKTSDTKEIEEILKDIDDSEPILSDNIPNEIKKNITKYTNAVINYIYDESLNNRLELIITSALKKKNTSGAAICSYSGRLNTRAIATRDDYRWWAQPNRSGHIKMYSKVHINLFIDNSGSFSKNEIEMNKFIRSLARISYKDFTFDIITINNNVVEWKNSNELFKAFGGNNLDSNIKDIIKKHIKPNANTYNIVLFDGDAHSDDYINYTSSDTDEPLKQFDLNNTIIITDEQNKEYLGEYLDRAILKYVTNYCDVFIDTICELLEREL